MGIFWEAGGGVLGGRMGTERVGGIDCVLKEICIKKKRGKGNMHYY